MPVSFVTGDLCANRFQAQALAHGCNCQGVMGAGLARTMRRHYLAMFAEYRRRCLARPRLFNPGDCWLWQEPGLPAVFNLATQEHYGRSGVYASVDALTLALAEMRRQAAAAWLTSIALPRLGAGLGGLEWPAVRRVLAAQLGDWPGHIWVYETYQPA